MPKISQYADGSPGVSTDEVVIRRGTANYRLPLSQLGSTGLPTGHMFGLTMSNNAGDATNDIDIAAGKCRSDDDTTDIVLASALTKQLDAVWAVGTNQGMRASGAAIANTTYHIFLIKRPDTGVVDIAADTSATGANLAANTNVAYTKKRRIGSIIRESAAIVGFVQDGDRFERKVPIAVTGSPFTNPGTAAVTRTLNVPVGIRVEAMISAIGGADAAADEPTAIFFSDLSQTDTAASAATGAFNTNIYNSAAVSNRVGLDLRVMTNTSAQIRSRLAVSGVTTVLYMTTHGWIDTRNRLA